MNPISETVKRIRDLTYEQIAEMLVAKDEQIAKMQTYADFGRASAAYFKLRADILKEQSDAKV